MSISKIISVSTKHRKALRERLLSKNFIENLTEYSIDLAEHGAAPQQIRQLELLRKQLIKRVKLFVG